MNFVIRQIFVCLYLILLVSCGGGSGLQEDTLESSPTSYSLSLQLFDSSGNPVQQIPQGKSVQAAALLLADNLPVSGWAVTFSATSTAMDSPIDTKLATDEQVNHPAVVPAHAGTQRLCP
ncbi:hypothetical protein SAMN04488540_103329 [Ferrimonas sediminum]|uniref:Uncharacterized protein n=1 Tax=Ferrimonas sediminum TaxID=718193 RepID=A0A1G8P440_9GAMM|nr:hypothetical protein [Ferrimonas sediminum]SDI87254.1 hypothetical protein SAMN04488540_103329 [Ferrimonas sediminum]